MKSILFIEDEAALQKTLGDALVQEGYEVVAALDGDIGLRLAKEKNPDLILLDLVLPRRDGFSVLSELKKNPSTAAVPVIVLTNLENMEDIQRVLDLGAMTYLVKSNYALQDVINKVKQACE